MLSYIPLIFTVIIIIISVTYFRRNEKKRVVLRTADSKTYLKKETKDACNLKSIVHIKILFGSQTGRSKSFAEELHHDFKKINVSCEVIDISKYNYEEELCNNVSNSPLFLFIISTHENGSPPKNCEYFFRWLKDCDHDFRISHGLLVGLKYGIFGLGNSLYGKTYNIVAKELNRILGNLHATQMHQLFLADENSDTSSLEEQFLQWKTILLRKLKNEDQFLEIEEKEICQPELSNCISDDEQENEIEILDMEDIGAAIKNKIDEGKETSYNETKEMLTPIIRNSLTKQGYKLTGSHSGVKLCRWTKSMLRGRGGCYKHTFYGIQSYLCMEATPSLACANKCIFCWRHHTNPVGTEWKWKKDDSINIVEEFIASHIKMIKELRGIPGIKEDRWKEAKNIRHCALSLVGEPIMYPDINELIYNLHMRNISTFLVTNGQFPEALKNLQPVTQVYVSVDASNKSSLKEIDRPLFQNFWERFKDSLQALAKKSVRTVYRLTLVKEWNIEDIEGYAKIVNLGNPSFIEIKGVTFCGNSKANKLTMSNVPWHEEVLYFTQKLNSYLPEYEIASEHEHSNCVLLAHKKFLKNGTWYTWIDYEKFLQLVKIYYNTGNTFTALEYSASTPDWAVYGSSDRGFDPSEVRFYRKQNLLSKL